MEENQILFVVSGDNRSDAMGDAQCAIVNEIRVREASFLGVCGGATDVCGDADGLIAQVEPFHHRRDSAMVARRCLCRGLVR